MTFTLVIGNKNYSSWSLRAWLAMRQAGIVFEEVLVPLSQPDTRARLLTHSPSGLVPVLRHGDRVIWESLAILEYLAEQGPGLWPEDPAARSFARSISAEMHAGFAALRTHMPMNLRKALPGRGRGPGVSDDIERVTAIWRECRDRFGTGGPFLFGRFTAADAMYAPVATRLRTYGVALDPVSQAWANAALAVAAFREWEEAARAEPWVIEEDEVA